MVVHLKKDGWEKTACGLSGSYSVTGLDSEATCANCCRFHGDLDNAWSSIRTIRKAFYLQRAGVGAVEGARMLRTKPISWTRKEQNLICRQLGSCPELARLINRPVQHIERGGSGDNRSSVSWEWQLKQLQDAGRCCPHCGGMI